MDHDQLRRVAATRPGYATYDDTRPGNPHWLRRQPSPCTWADRPGTGLLCVRADHQHGTPPTAEPSAPVTEPAVDEHQADTVAGTPPSRRRWWHRLTRSTR
ncbi:hypothetical protein [Micromonospora echinospora]|uniref:hypothetical protein n=1 Tax=Micromonospora echinospora TaxID=1877 RepID=UPI003A8AE460